MINRSLSANPTDNNIKLSPRIAEKSLELTTETSIRSSIRTLNIREPNLYVQTGQYLAIGFGCGSTRLCLVKGTDSFYITRNLADNALHSGESVEFIRQAIFGLTFSFKITPETGILYEVPREKE